MRAKVITLSSVASLHFAALACIAAAQVDIGHQIAAELQSGKYAEAKTLVDEALKKSPRDARLWTLDGLTLVRLSRQDEAIAAFQRALQLSPDYLPALEGAAEIEYQTGKGDPTPLLRQIIKLRPEDETARNMLTSVVFRQSDCDAAKSQITVTNSTPAISDIPTLQLFGACLIRHKRFTEAGPVFAQLAALQPGDRKATYDVAAVQFLLGRYTDVVATLSNDSIGRSPDADSLDLLAEAYEFQSDGSRAVEMLKHAIALRPDVPQYYADLAYIHLAHRKFQEGLELVESGLKRNPNAAPLYVARGVFRSELGQFDEGMNDFATAEKIDPNVELSSEARGLANLQRDNLPETEQMARERIRQHPGNAFLYYILGEALRKKGAAPGTADFDEAVAALRESVELNPHLTLARDALAALYLQAGKLDEAVEQSRFAFNDNPNDETAIYHLILALRKTNRTSEIPTLAKQLARLKAAARPNGLTERSDR